MHAGGTTVEITTESAISEITEYHPPDDNLGTGMYAFLFIVIYYAVYSIHLFLCSLHAQCLRCWPLANCRTVALSIYVSAVVCYNVCPVRLSVSVRR